MELVVPHGRVVESEACFQGKRLAGSWITLACDSDYHLSGYGSLTCAGYGNYNRPVPTCEGKLKCLVCFYFYLRHKVISVIYTTRAV